MRPKLLVTVAVCSLAATAALAQVNYEPTPRPRTSAVDRDWYRDGDPIPFAGDLYYPDGPTVYFNGNTMVPTGSYDGVTLYADTTLEPYSVVFVPVGDKLLRPYERVREGYPMGRTGRIGNRGGYPAYSTESGEDQPYPRQGGVGGQPPPPQRDRRRSGPPQRGAPFEERPEELLVETVRKPIDNLGIWVLFQGYRWEHAGDAVPLDPAKLVSVGQYYGLPVYADARTPYVIYIPLRDNLVAPFRRTP